MTQPRLIFHCGLQKTASTSLHHFVQSNAEAMPRGLAVLTPSKGSLTRQIGRAAIAYSLDPSSPKKAHLQDAVRAVLQTVDPQARTILISHENLPGAMPGCLGEMRLYPMLEAITDALDACVAPMVPDYVFYRRDLEAWKPSVHNQAVKTDRYCGSFAQYLVETAEIADWTGFETRVHDHLGVRGHVLRLEDERDPKRPGWQLLRLAGMTDDAIAALSPVKGRSNQSLSPAALEFMRLVNGLDLPNGPHHKIERLVQSQRDLFRNDTE